MGEGFSADNTPDFWLIEMSGIPFGVMSETLDAKNIFRGMIYGMLPRLPWTGNPVPLWNLWDYFGMKEARMHGYWDKSCGVRTSNNNIPATVYLNGDKAMVVLANWSDTSQICQLRIDESLLCFNPAKAFLPAIKYIQQYELINNKGQFEIAGREGKILILER